MRYRPDSCPKVLSNNSPSQGGSTLRVFRPKGEFPCRIRARKTQRGDGGETATDQAAGLQSGVVAPPSIARRRDSGFGGVSVPSVSKIWIGDNGTYGWIYVHLDFIINTQCTHWNLPVAGCGQKLSGRFPAMRCEGVGVHRWHLCLFLRSFHPVDERQT